MRLLFLVCALALVAVPAAAHHSGDVDCGDFSSQAEAKQHLDAHPGDPDGIDGDRDGRPCETLPPGSASTPSPSPSPAPQYLMPPTRTAARIVSVVDGDTVRVRLKSGKRRTVRLLGIDTPETGKPGVGVECGGRAATKALKALALRGRKGEPVTLTSDPGQGARDRYGRTLAYVTRTRDGRDLGRAQVTAGWSTAFVYGGRPFSRHAAYKRAEDAARVARRGVWGACGGDFHSRQG